VPIVLIDLKQEQLDEPLRTEEDVAGPELPNRYAIFLQVLHHIQQTAHDVEELALTKTTSLQFFLLNGSLEGEVVVVAVGVDLLVLYADLGFCIT
jgi:hypothetical protein